MGRFLRNVWWGAVLVACTWLVSNAIAEQGWFARARAQVQLEQYHQAVQAMRRRTLLMQPQKVEEE